ncbi:hypothetical protein JCM19241_3675 [Vibrio ishigakensis]|uniref:Uncharacterized protein n=1 Tax=Vibrio ishigakensis TaxID=1481914 RepID=A0A0B8QKZ1_9VIBR|nr:hypothetical protein JCM19241_3675 [Vibrio ishigakensis]
MNISYQPKSMVFVKSVLNIEKVNSTCLKRTTEFGSGCLT